MRVLFVINSLGAGGAEQSLAEMMPLFRQDGIEPVVACLEQRREGVQSVVQEQGFDVRFLVGQGWWPRIHQVRSLLREVGPDLIHTTIFEADAIGRIAAIGRGVPVVTSLVNTPYEPIRLQDPNVRPWRLAVVKMIDGSTARRLTTHFHAITHAVKEAAVRDLRIEPDRITVVERGRDAARLGEPSPERRARARQRLGLRAHDVVLVTLGRQEFQKGQWHLLDAMVRLVPGHPDVRLLIGGRRGNATPKLEQVMRTSSLNGEVRFLGHRDDAPEMLAAADVFVFPSLYEGLGGALIEAMALGLPIVASDLPAIREVVEPGRNAVLVTPGSPGDLSAALEALVADAGRRQAMGARSRQIFEQRFTLERSTARMVELLRRVATNGRRRAT